MKQICICYLAWNLIVTLVYALDKSRAVRAERRIRERTLLLFSFIVGGVGAMLGMVLFNHKTSKMKFRILGPLSFVINIAVFLAVSIRLYG